MISSLKIKLNRSWKIWRNWNVPLVLLEQATCGVNGKDGKHKGWAHGGLVALIMMDHDDKLFL
jgi:hypothetical protein